MSIATIHEIEENIKEARKIAALGETLERLRNNKDFREIIMEGYFKQEAIRLVHLKSDPACQSADSQKSILMQIDAIGSLDMYFRTIYHNAAQAMKAVDAGNDMLDDLNEEAGDE